MQPATLAWLENLDLVMKHGEVYIPRGMETRELLAFSSTIDMNYPVVHVEARKLGYKFMSAEAAWILSGDNRVETIAPYSKAISKFSDDGVFFHGAYGPPIMDQLSYVCRKLTEDPDTRQAVLTIWRKNPGQTKDTPCTVAVQWFIRNNQLCCVDMMRSSDLWLGWPYDVFNFTMLSWYIRAMLRDHHRVNVDMGSLTLMAGSQHIYQPNFEGVQACLDEFMDAPPSGRVGPAISALSPGELVDRLWEVSEEGDGALELLS